MSQATAELHPSEYQIFSAPPSHFLVFTKVLQVCNRDLLSVLATGYFYLIVFLVSILAHLEN